MERFCCLNCSNVVTLNVHGRCEHCDSDAVVHHEIAGAPKPQQHEVSQAGEIR